MKSTYAALAAMAAAIAVAGVFAGWYLTDDSATGSAVEEQCGDRTYGHVSSLTQSGDRYELRFDPAWFTSGVTANTAAAEDGVVAPGEPVPNDNYRVEEGHRLLTYLVPLDAPVTVLARTADASGFEATPVTVAELAELVEGGEPVELFEPLDTGVWIRVHVDTVCTIDQQYLP